jgi:hypothetical protein
MAIMYRKRSTKAGILSNNGWSHSALTSQVKPTFFDALNRGFAKKHKKLNSFDFKQ